MSADIIDKVLGVAGGASWVLSYIFYRLYQRRTETAKQVRNIPIWEPDENLHAHLSQNGNLAYAAIEGVVKELGRALNSPHNDNEGVIRESQLTEHKSQRINGFWSDVKKVIRDSTEHVPFAITTGKSDSAKYKVEVLDPGQASRLKDELVTTFNQFEPNKSSVVQIGIDRLFGEVSKGLEESEKMLLTGTSILGVGKVFLERGQMKISPPDDDGRTYILTKMRLSELVRHFEAQSSMYKIIAVVTALVGGGILSIVVWRQTRLWLEQRKQRLQFEAIRRSVAEAAERRRARNAVSGGGEENEAGTENACVVCLTNPRQVVALNCGHISLCADCAEALPLPKKCPVCRASVERFLPVFHP